MEITSTGILQNFSTYWCKTILITYFHQHLFHMQYGPPPTSRDFIDNMVRRHPTAAELRLFRRRCIMHRRRTSVLCVWFWYNKGWYCCVSSLQTSLSSGLHSSMDKEGILIVSFPIQHNTCPTCRHPLPECENEDDMYHDEESEHLSACLTKQC